MKKTKVSVIIPVYNSEPFLAECLNSVINQTLREIEIICIDDGSSDNSLNILNEFSRRDSRITVLSQNRQYAGVARNKGMEMAKGEYLSFLDSDDFFEPTLLEKMYNAAKKDDVDVVICNAKIYFDGKYLEEKFLITENIPHGIFSCYDPKFAQIVFQSIVPMPWNKLFKASFIRSRHTYFSSTLHHNDAAFVMSNIIAAHKLLFLPEHLVYWRYKPDSLCRHPIISDSVYRSIKDLYQYIRNLENYPLVERSFINFIIDYSTRFYNFEQNEEIKLLATACIKAFYNEYNIGRYPTDYFYQPAAYQLFILLAQAKLLPVGL